MRDNRFWEDYARGRLPRDRTIWDEHAEAMRLLAEGNRLIARDIAKGMRFLWRAAVGRFTDATYRQDRGGRRPPA